MLRVWLGIVSSVALGLIGLALLWHFFAPPQAIVDIDTTTKITLERGACFGRCPVYSVVIINDGRVTFTGLADVAKASQHEATISRADLRKLLNTFITADFFSLDDHYETQRVTDMSTVVVSLTYHGQTKTVRHYLGDSSAPRSLTELENYIDNVVNTNQWIKP